MMVVTCHLGVAILASSFGLSCVFANNPSTTRCFPMDGQVLVGRIPGLFHVARPVVLA